MGYTLGDITLKRPASFRREEVEIGGNQLTLTGRTTKDIRKRKERFTLSFQNLTQTQVSEILGEYNLEETRDFEVSETNLTIASTPVHISITARSYVAGADYRENMTLTLIEVI